MIEHHIHGAVLVRQHRGDAPAEVQLSPHLGIGGHAQNIGGAAEPADHPGSLAGDGAHNDGLGVHIDGHGAGGVGNGVQIVLNAEAGLVEPVTVAGVLLGVLGDLRHGGHRLNGVLTGSGLAGEHDGGGAVVHGVGHVGNLRPGGPGVLNHGFQHLGSGDHPLAQQAALVNQPLLNGGQLHKGDFHTQVASGHHDALAGLANSLNIVHTGLVLDLGDDLDALAAVFVQEIAHIQHILLGGNKGRGHKVHIVLDAPQQVLLVRLGQEGAGHHLIGKGHALAVAEVAAHHTYAVGVAALQLLYLKNHQAVVDQHPVAYGQILNQALVIDGDPGLVALHLIHGEGKFVTGVYMDLAVFEGADPVLGALGIQQDGNGQIQLLTDLFDQVNLLLLLLMGAVGKIQPGHIHTGQAHFFQSLLVLGGGANGADNLGFPHKHLSLSIDFRIPQHYSIF